MTATQHEKYEVRIQCPCCKKFIWVKIEKEVEIRDD